MVIAMDLVVTVTKTKQKSRHCAGSFVLFVLRDAHSALFASVNFFAIVF
ncbi:MAG: hypothetical protein RIS43_18 [Actinomycetota bacterium]